jgi:hypothetical protein
MTDANEAAMSIGRSATKMDPLDATEAFLAVLSSGIDRGRCADLAATIAAWAIERRIELGRSDPERDAAKEASCFAHMQETRRRETARLEILAAEEITATLHSLAAGSSALALEVLLNMVVDVRDRLRSRTDLEAFIGEERARLHGAPPLDPNEQRPAAPATRI